MAALSGRLPWKLPVVGILLGAAMWCAPALYLWLFERDGICIGFYRNFDVYRELSSAAFRAGFTEGARGHFTVDVLSQHATCTMELDGRQANFTAGHTLFSRVGLGLGITSGLLLVARTAAASRSADQPR